MEVTEEQPDDFSAAGEAAFGTEEWASKNINILNGCPHNCHYCYAKAGAIRFGRRTADNWKTPVVNQPMVAKGWAKRDGNIMFGSTHDLTPEHLEECITVLRKVLQAGNEVLIVSKPHLVSIERVCHDLEEFKPLILFRFTIGSADEAVLKAWEPGAPSFAERIACLKYAHERGFETSVSCEPMLDGNIHAVIEATRPYVTDAIWLGRVNNLRLCLALNKPDDEAISRRAEALLELMSDDYLKSLYERYQADPQVKWKDSIKRVVGLERPTEKGLDV